MKKVKKTLEKKSVHVKSALPLLVSSGSSTKDSEMQSIFAMMEKLLHWAAIIESSDDAIISKSIDGYITSWNRGAQRLYGYTSKEIIGKHISILMPSEREDDFLKIISQLQMGKKIEHYETKRKTKYGKIIDVSITVSPIRDSQGTIIGASKIARDITDRIEIEKRRDDFVSTTSHELKTPITSQKVFGELLENMIKKNGHTEYLPYTQKINRQTDKLTKLIEDLLDISRVRAGRLKLERAAFSIDNLIREIADMNQLTTQHKVAINGKTGKKVFGDRERLGQVITNLLSNAAKYSPRVKKILIDLQAVKNTVLISVQDFGIGISPEYHEKVFERFFRVSDIDEKTYPGMGIGLHLCKEIVIRHGGAIWVDSQKGKGATFYVSLPAIA